MRGNVVFEKGNAALSVGNRCFIGKTVISIADGVGIGDDVLISWGLTITDHNSHSLKFYERQCDAEGWHGCSKNWTGVKIGKVVIQDKAWIGCNVIVLKGVTIGEGAIVEPALLSARMFHPIPSLRATRRDLLGTLNHTKYRESHRD